MRCTSLLSIVSQRRRLLRLEQIDLGSMALGQEVAQPQPDRSREGGGSNPARAERGCQPAAIFAHQVHQAASRAA